MMAAVARFPVRIIVSISMEINEHRFMLFPLLVQ